MIRFRYFNRTRVALRMGAALLYLALAGASLLHAREPGPLQYNRDIRPILSDHCFQCHGPDAKNRKGRLRLDERENAIQRKAIQPGRPEQSSLIERIYHEDPEEIMPPPATHKPLTPEQKDRLKRWIAEGAAYEPHWAYMPQKRPPVPAVRDASWMKNPIDAFVLSVLEQRQLQPSPEADRRTLIRRLSLDLTGLPPAPEEVEAFVRDRSARAYERLVDRLLDSPHYGERMAVPWLDLVRFADTVGYHGDQNQNVFPYREYVIRAFNSNKPFHQFTLEQIAGDLLTGATPEQKVATGFNRLNMMTREGGAQPREYLAKYAADRVRTVSTTWLGSTMACAECHDHKYDPFTAKDFYQMAAFFADVRQWGVYHDYPYTPNPDLRGFSNDHPFPPEIEVESPYLRQRAAKLVQKMQALYDAALRKVRQPDEQARFEAWRASVADFLKRNPEGWEPLQPESPAPAMGQALQDGVFLFQAQKNATEKLQFQLPAGGVAALRIELIPHEQHKGRVVRAQQAGLFQVALALKKGDEKEVSVPVHFAEAAHKEPRYRNGFALLGVREGWRLPASRLAEPLVAEYLLERPWTAETGERLVLTFKDNPAGALRVSISPLGIRDGAEENPARLLRSLTARRPGREAAAAYLSGTAADAEAFASLRKLHLELQECNGGKAPSLVTESWKPLVTRVLPRGNWLDESGEVVAPAPPHFLPAASLPQDRPLTRLDLAHWLIAPENPLTSRVMVNRLWKLLFGNGLCNTVDDFGAQGEPPTHPELLDWLAVEFRESGWDVKRIVKQMAMSSTYRQNSRLRPEILEFDPHNRLLSSQSPRRLEAEFVRDNALQIAGLLQLDIGGPSARPYQPPGYYANLQFPDRDYVAHTDDRQYRRGVYMHWQRTFLHPMLANFDAPAREECTALRTVSNTPQQALTLLNDPTFFEAARVFALAAHRRQGKDADKLKWIYQKALARAPTPREQESLIRFLAEQRLHYREHSEEAARIQRVGLSPAPEGVDLQELAAWTSVTRVVLNLHETLTRY